VIAQYSLDPAAMPRQEREHEPVILGDQRHELPRAAFEHASTGFADSSNRQPPQIAPLAREQKMSESRRGIKRFKNDHPDQPALGHHPERARVTRDP
jgi:hypothetical protein